MAVERIAEKAAQDATAELVDGPPFVKKMRVVREGVRVSLDPLSPHGRNTRVNVCHLAIYGFLGGLFACMW